MIWCGDTSDQEVRLRSRIKRWWCRNMHAHKTEHVRKNLYRKRCLECSEVYLYRVVDRRDS